MVHIDPANAAWRLAEDDVVKFREVAAAFAPLISGLVPFTEDDGWGDSGWSHGVDFFLTGTPAQILEFSTWIDGAHTAGIWCRWEVRELDPDPDGVEPILLQVGEDMAAAVSYTAVDQARGLGLSFAALTAARGNYPGAARIAWSTNGAANARWRELQDVHDSYRIAVDECRVAAGLLPLWATS